MGHTSCCKQPSHVHSYFGSERMSARECVINTTFCKAHDWRQREKNKVRTLTSSWTRNHSRAAADSPRWPAP